MWVFFFLIFKKKKIRQIVLFPRVLLEKRGVVFIFYDDWLIDRLRQLRTKFRGFCTSRTRNLGKCFRLAFWVWNEKIALEILFLKLIFIFNFPIFSPNIKILFQNFKKLIRITIFFSDQFPFLRKRNRPFKKHVYHSFCKEKNRRKTLAKSFVTWLF